MTVLALLAAIAIAGITYARMSERQRKDRTVTALPARLSVRYFDDTVLLTDADAWTYLRLPTISVEFRTAEEWDRIIQVQAHALAGLTYTQIHVKTVFREYDIPVWASIDESRVVGRDNRNGVEEGITDTSNQIRCPWS